MKISDLLGRVKNAMRPAIHEDEPAPSSRVESADSQAKELVSSFLRMANTYAEPDAITGVLEAEPAVQIAVIHKIYADTRASAWQTRTLLTRLMARKHPFTAEDLELLLARAVACQSSCYRMTPALLRHVRRHVEEGNPLTPSMRKSLDSLKQQLTHGYQNAETRKEAAAVGEILGDSCAVLPDPGETWSDLAIADIGSVGPEESGKWRELLAHAQTADGSKPSRAWQQAAEKLISPLGEAFSARIDAWFSAVSLPRVVTQEHTYSNYTYQTHEPQCSDRNISLLKGLAWCCAGVTEPKVIRAVARMAEAALKKVPSQGPWAVRAASAAIWALGETESAESVAALSRLRLKVTHRTALGQIDKAIDLLAARQGIPREELEDLSVPAFGLDSTGLRCEQFGEYMAQMRLEPAGTITISWFGSGGKPLKAAPAAVKRDCSDDLKALKADADAAQKTLTAQRSRIESGLLTGRAIPFDKFRERYLSHPLLGYIARRLIWRFGTDEVGIWEPAVSGFVRVDGSPIAGLDDDVAVRLWHPIHGSVEQIEAWREYLEKHEIRQPFKQAHREIYLLTDAEIRTRVYSNRFASHILKQHQFHQLASYRGWRNKLRLMVDDEYPPTQLLLPQYGLRAEFWVEGAGEETNDSGTYLYLATDQVRFHPIDAAENSAHAGGGGYHAGWQAPPAEPLPLDTVPPLVFSEVMRDVDLFVGVASVGNDPNWADGGPEGRYQDYWQSYSFGDLTATAVTRRSVLERLIPRLKIASRSHISGKFLVVRGDIRTYKIHLGSGNILMEPNDQYLCIVPDRSAAARADGKVFLPFEGDATLSVILSKAFLLAEDTKITDATIVSQLKR